MSLLKKYVLPFGVVFALVVLIDLLTNGVPKELLFDSKIYIGMAQHGFAKDRISPFIFRFAGPFLAGSLDRWTGLSLYNSFKVFTYLGAIGLLLGIFLFVRRLTTSEKSAYVGMLSVAFSLYTIKYPLFDVYRPDILAYPIILIATWLAWKDRFLPLLLTTLIGLQFREFTIAPLLAYLAVKLQREGWRASLGRLAISGIGLFLAIGLPRLLIPVEGHIEAVELSGRGMGQAIHLLSTWARDLNIVYIILAYFLPLLIFYFGSQRKAAVEKISAEQVSYLAYYSGVVFLLLLIGGSDLDRFATYFFLPLAVLIGYLAKDRSWTAVSLVLVIQILFNRIWLPFPVSEAASLVDFYSGWSNVINAASLWRFTELIALIILGRFLIHLPVSSTFAVEKT